MAASVAKGLLVLLPGWSLEPASNRRPREMAVARDSRGTELGLSAWLRLTSLPYLLYARLVAHELL
jgi:hypothetical protein